MKPIAKGLMMAGGAAMMAFATFGSAAAQQGTGNPPTLTVDNTRNVPVVVYLERGVFDTRLGTVAPHGREIIKLPPNFPDEQQVQIFVHPEGGVDLGTQDLTIRNGMNVTLLVPTNDAGYVSRLPKEVIPNPGKGTTTVTVQNGRSQQVTLFLQRGDLDIRLGVVPAHQDRTLAIPTWLTEQQEHRVELFVHPEGGFDLASQTFQLTPGAHLLVEVPVDGG